jgi:hypothetical protein
VGRQRRGACVHRNAYQGPGPQLRNALTKGTSTDNPRRPCTWGGKTWVTAPATLQAKTTVAGLVPGSTAQFKYRAVTKTGEGDWSQRVSLMVH